MVAVTFDMDSKPEPDNVRRRSSLKHTESKEDLLSVDAGDVDVDALPTYYTALRIAPLIGLFSLAMGTVGPVMTELIKIKSCEVELNYTQAVCDNLRNHTQEARAVQKLTSNIKMYETMIDSLPAMLFSLFLGSWSDEYGRKLPMLIPFVGMAIAYTFTLICTYVSISPYYLMITPLLVASTGGTILINVAIFSYVADYTNDKTRSANYAIVDAMQSLMRYGGTALGGQLMAYGQSVPFYLVLCLHVCSFFYVFFVIRELRTFKSIRECRIGDVITVERVKQNWRTVFRPRPGYNRMFLLLIMACIVVSAVCIVGDMSIMQLYLEFEPFNWTVQHYSLYMAATGVIESIVMVFTNIVLRRFFSIRDTLIGAIASLSAILHLLFYGLATSSAMIYVAAGVGVLKMLGFVSIKSVTISLVERDEIAKIMSAKMSLMSIAPFLGVTIFTNIFTHTNEWWPGFCFVLGACIASPVVLVFVAFYIIQKREAKKPEDNYDTETPRPSVGSLDDVKTKV